MADKNDFSLTTKELVQLLSQKGYTKKAKEITKRYLPKGERETEIKGFDLQNYSQDDYKILKYLAESQYCVVFENEAKVLIIHSIKLDKKILTEVIEDNKHIFSIMDLEEDFYKLMIRFYHLQDISKIDLYKTALAMDVSSYDHIHEMNKVELEKFIHNHDSKISVKHFLEDFAMNNQKINSIVFMKKGRVLSMEFFVPSMKCIWEIDYINVKSDEIIIRSVSAENYFDMIGDLIRKVFTDFEGEETKINDKLFSLKRGLPFFIKSNIVLALMLLVILINRNSWVYDGEDFYELLGFFSEVLILFISIIACFRPRSVKLKGRN